MQQENEQREQEDIGLLLREYVAMCIFSSETEHYPLLQAIAVRREHLQRQLLARGVAIRNERG